MRAYVFDLDIKLRSAILIDGARDGEHVIELLEVVVDDVLLPYVVLERASFTLILNQAILGYLYADTRSPQEISVSSAVNGSSIEQKSEIFSTWY